MLFRSARPGRKREYKLIAGDCPRGLTAIAELSPRRREPRGNRPAATLSVLAGEADRRGRKAASTPSDPHHSAGIQPRRESARGMPGMRPRAVDRSSWTSLDEKQKFAHVMECLIERASIPAFHRRLDRLIQINQFFLIFFVDMIEQLTGSLD